MKDSLLTRKEREKNFRRKEIIDAAVNLFARKGFNSTTLEEIADAAEFGKGTLYNYFGGKEEIYSAIIDDVILNNEKIIKQNDMHTETFVEFIEKYTADLFSYCITNKNAFLIFVREIARLDRNYNNNINIEDLFKKQHEIKKIFYKRVEKGIKDKEIREFNPQKIATLYNLMVFPYINHMILCSPKEFNNINKETDFFLSVFFDGVKVK